MYLDMYKKKVYLVIFKYMLAKLSPESFEIVSKAKRFVVKSAYRNEA